MKIAVLLTTFNRKQKTLACLNSLSRQKLPENVVLDIHLTDDSSSDGTAEAVKYYYPEANVYQGNGSLFWAGGMRNSWHRALGKGYDYFLLLNDDTVLTETALTTLLSPDVSSGGQHTAAICIGSTADTEGRITYGGRKVKSKIFMNSVRVYSETDYSDCDLGNANIMLVPSAIVRKIGILANDFTHGIADYDFTLKAKEAGFRVLVAPGILGMCIHDHDKNWKSSEVSLRDRINYLKSPKGLAYNEYLTFIRSHFPFYYPSAFFKLWMKTLCPVLWDKLKKQG